MRMPFTDRRMASENGHHDMTTADTGDVAKQSAAVTWTLLRAQAVAKVLVPVAILGGFWLVAHAVQLGFEQVARAVTAK